MFCDFLSIVLAIGSRIRARQDVLRLRLATVVHPLRGCWSSITAPVLLNRALRRVLTLDESDNFSSMCKTVRVLPNVPRAIVFAMVLRPRRPPHETGLNTLFNLRRRIFWMDPHDPSYSSASSWLR